METLELIIRISLVLHLLGFAAIMAGVLNETKRFKTGAPVNRGILHGAWLALLTGLLMTGLVYANGETANSLVLSIKGLGITGIFFIAYTYSKKDSAPKWVVPTIGLLTIINLITAVVIGAVE
ncbi:MAG: hypothetical protein RIS82_1221 [Actinomycetota bacterium]|jgi:uncharacterized membrane protein HdeD (DUF308 family)